MFNQLSNPPLSFLPVGAQSAIKPSPVSSHLQIQVFSQPSPPPHAGVCVHSYQTIPTSLHIHLFTVSMPRPLSPHPPTSALQCVHSYQTFPTSLHIHLFTVSMPRPLPPIPHQHQHYSVFTAITPIIPLPLSTLSHNTSQLTGHTTVI